MPAHVWEPIKKIPEDLISFSDQSLRELENEWNETRKKLDPNQIIDLNSRLEREWAIETGKIENLYTLDEGTTVLLIQHGIHSNLISHNSTNLLPEITTSHILDQKEVIEWLFNFIKEDRRLTLSDIRNMHAVFTRTQDRVVAYDFQGNRIEVQLLKGRWKQLPNSPLLPDDNIFEYCPPEQVENEMQNLLAWYLDYKKTNITPEVLSAWLHHRFVLIHPFQDGNGRVARALATLEFIKSGGLPLIIQTRQKKEYLDTLQAADDENLLAFIQFFSRLQKDQLYKAIQHCQDTLYKYPDMSSNNKIKENSIYYELAEKYLKEMYNLTNNEFEKIKTEFIELGADTSYVNYPAEFSAHLKSKAGIGFSTSSMYDQNSHKIDCRFSWDNISTIYLLTIHPEKSFHKTILDYRNWLKKNIQEYLEERVI